MPKPIKKQRWSNIDVFGLLRGLGIWNSQYTTLQYVRRPFDTKLTIRDKIQNLNDNPPSLTKQGLLNGLCVEFGYNNYNLSERMSFQLSYNPLPSGGSEVQDIFVSFRAVGETGVWTDLYPQVWESDYETAKANKQGFIVWPQENYLNLSDYKNLNYSRNLEIFEELDDNTEIQIKYLVAYIDENNEKQVLSFTDGDNLNNPNDNRFLYRRATEEALQSGITVYKLSEIPSSLSGKYFNSEGQPTQQLYKIKEYFKKQYKYTWNDIRSNSAIWDIAEVYCSGELANFYDAWIPTNDSCCLSAEGQPIFSGYIDGINYLSNALYLSEIVENATSTQEWYPKIYPGSFHIDGIPYRLFEDPKITGLVFAGGVADLPSGLTRGMYTILAMSGYYENGCTDPDIVLSGFIFEDYWAPCGKGGDELWGYIYRHRPFLSSAQGIQINLELGQYNIDYEAGKIYLNSEFTSGTLIWDNAIVPSGRIIQYDLNPLNQTAVNLQKFFLYLENIQQ